MYKNSLKLHENSVWGLARRPLRMFMCNGPLGIPPLEACTELETPLPHSLARAPLCAGPMEDRLGPSGSIYSSEEALLWSSCLIYRQAN